MASDLKRPERYHRATAADVQDWLNGANLTDEERTHLLSYERVTFNRPDVIAVLEGGPAPAPTPEPEA